MYLFSKPGLAGGFSLMMILYFQYKDRNIFCSIYIFKTAFQFSVSLSLFYIYFLLLYVTNAPIKALFPKARSILDRLRFEAFDRSIATSLTAVSSLSSCQLLRRTVATAAAVSSHGSAVPPSEVLF